MLMMLSTTNLILLISGIAVVIAVLMYFAGSGKAIRIPAVILGTIGGVGLGIVLGFVLFAIYEGDLGLDTDNDPAKTIAATMPGFANKGAEPPKSGGGGGMMGGGRAPNPKMQLVSLVTKLDQLTAKPLVVTLDDDQKTKVQEQLKGLESLDALGDEEAKKRLDSLLSIVENQRETLEAAGYRWPGAPRAGGGGGPGNEQPANPFTVEANADHLKALNERLKPATAEATP